jgi:hypothetical protein
MSGHTRNPRRSQTLGTGGRNGPPFATLIHEDSASLWDHYGSPKNKWARTIWFTYDHDEEEWTVHLGDDWLGEEGDEGSAVETAADALAETAGISTHKAYDAAEEAMSLVQRHGY